METTLLARHTFVPLVVPGLSTSSGSSSSSTSRPQDQSTHSGETGTISSDPVTNRRDKPAAGNRMQEKQNRMETEDPTQGIPDWLRDFTANLEEERHVLAYL